MYRSIKPSIFFVQVLLAACLGVSAYSTHASTQVDIHGPAGSFNFGTSVTVLPNGNFVVTDPLFSSARGAVYLYGPNGILISALTGSSAGDYVGEQGIVVLPNGDFVVLSENWSNQAATRAGAATWVNGTTGLSGAVSATNSLVGTTAYDEVGHWSATVLSNGNYVVVSPNWNNSSGAVTWANGATGLSGPVSSANSLVGAQGDQVGRYGVAALTNGNYVVSSPFWNNGTVLEAGAATWADGTVGLTGLVSENNSLVGTQNNDEVSAGLITPLANGNYVVGSPAWNNGVVSGVGAATWANGTTGLIGHVTSSNSLVGSSPDDNVANGCGCMIDPGIIALTNGNYVVRSSQWNNGAALRAGAATWGNGTTGLVGTVSSSNSLVGSTTDDRVSFSGVAALSNGNYVVASSYWNDGATSGVGAATWLAGFGPFAGTVSPSNSLVGSSQFDQVTYGGVTALVNGNYVVASMTWNNNEIAYAGAATWGNGTVGIVGPVSANNSLVGTTDSDRAGALVVALSNGNYVVASPDWSNGSVGGVGAVTWADGATGLAGSIAQSNSFVGTSVLDSVSYNGGVRAFSDGSYAIISNIWHGGSGAVSFANGALKGTVATSNSVLGTTSGYGMTATYDPNAHQLIVGRPSDNIVTLWDTDKLFASGFEP